MNKPDFSIVIPLYNEAENIPELIKRLNNVITSFNYKTEVVFVNDGSTDNTSHLINEIADNDNKYQIIELSRNFGHQIAITVGLEYSRAKEAVFILDGDLQDPPELLLEFWEMMQHGYDVVYGIRQFRKEGYFKRFLYKLFYRFLSRITNIDLPIDSGDFSLISRRVIDILNKMPEENRYIRGMRAWVGFKQTGIKYERKERSAGKSKYTFSKLAKLAYNGIFNFSEYPIKFITLCGFFAFIISLVYSLHVLYMRFYYGDVPEGFTALLFTVIMFGGIQLMSIGILGEYLTRIYFQTRNRPLYIIKKKKFN